MKLPGFVDIQVNGFVNIDFSNSALTENKFIRACTELFKRGTALFLPTVITSSKETYAHVLPLIAKVMNRPEFKNKIPGFHIEGPFISSEAGYVGAHPIEYVRKPDIKFFDYLWELTEGKIKILTVAAELDGIEELIQYATDKGVSVSLGHQNANYDELFKAAAAGAKTITHITNGVANQINRHNNVIWASLAIDELDCLCITDGHHVPPALIKVILKVKTADKFIVTSDASPLAGCPPGKYHTLGIEAVLEESGYLYNPERQCLVGSSATMIQCMNYLASLDLLSPEELLQVSFYNPLKLIDFPEDSIESHTYIEFSEKDKRFVVL